MFFDVHFVSFSLPGTSLRRLIKLLWRFRVGPSRLTRSVARILTPFANFIALDAGPKHGLSAPFPS
jgi:hypothetical protein